MKNNKVSIPIAIGVVVLIIGIIVITNQGSDIIMVEDSFEEELKPENVETDEIQEKLDEIEKNKIENEYQPNPREWITSGPFQIDRSEYVLGEKIFLRIGGLTADEKGEVVFHRPAKSIDDSIYLTIPFDGTTKSGFNYYIEPQLSKTKGFCTSEDFVGEWTVVFRGTNYESMKFRIMEKILPGEEEDYQSLC
ncbi:hypothetical protein [Nitrosopumilus sp.]|uniref:hypothetical protein n=1 Tax=Nitrosopumilus sp. TaxID=2024843 RepID=UPI002931756C|nr:hypothetical protein [Nitrosopumilus sp.]